MQLRHMEIVQDADKLKVDIQQTCMQYKTIKQWAYILHDKDDTRPHYHIYLNFHPSVGKHCRRGKVVSAELHRRKGRGAQRGTVHREGQRPQDGRTAVSDSRQRQSEVQASVQSVGGGVAISTLKAKLQRQKL